MRAMRYRNPSNQKRSSKGQRPHVRCRNPNKTPATSEHANQCYRLLFYRFPALSSIMFIFRRISCCSRKNRNSIMHFLVKICRFACFGWFQLISNFYLFFFLFWKTKQTNKKTNHFFCWARTNSAFFANVFCSSSISTSPPKTNRRHIRSKQLKKTKTNWVCLKMEENKNNKKNTLRTKKKIK